MEIRGEADPERVIAQYTSRGTLRQRQAVRQHLRQPLPGGRVVDGKIVYSAEYFDSIALLAGLTPPDA